jgi:DNA topoisomerase-1
MLRVRTHGGHDLRYVRDDEPGLRRRGRRRFVYIDEATGERVTGKPLLDRVRRLAIPPAWRGVWICADPLGHLQATGRDDRGRKQYRYHPAYRALREREKFADLVPFGEALGDLRARIEHDLATPGLGPDRVVALAIALLDRTAIRVGNEAYARDNRTFGLTTLRTRHVHVSGSMVSFDFKGKGAQGHEVEVDDRRLAKLVRRCRQLPGQLLFQYEDEVGVARPVRSDDVNERLRALTGLDVTAKTFRTWHATVRAARLLADAGPPGSARAARSTVAAACDEVGDWLGNTRAVCRASYVHPAVPAAFEAGVLGDWWRDGPTRKAGNLESDERRLLVVLRQARRRDLGTMPSPRGRREEAA